MFSVRHCLLWALVGAVLGGGLLAEPGLAPAADVVISTDTTEYADYTVTGRLIVESGASLTVYGFLDVQNSIINNADASITTSGTLTSGEDVTNDDTFVVQGTGLSFVAGNLINRGTFTFGNGVGAADLDVLNLSNTSNAKFVFLPGATLSVAGAISNAGDVTFQMADFELGTGRALNNSGNWILTQGNFTNRGTTSNAAGGLVSLSSGFFENRGTLSNDGQIRLSFGDFFNLAGAGVTNNGTMTLTRGDLQNYAGGTLTNTGTVTLTSGAYLNAGTTNNSTGATITLADGNFQNQTGGTVNNGGTIQVTSGSYLNQGTTANQAGATISVAVGDFENKTGGTVTNLGRIEVQSGKYVNQGTTTNQGTVAVASGRFENNAGTVTNSGIIQVDSGQYVNRAKTNNQAGGLVFLAAGNFVNEADTVTNNGEIRLALGDYVNQAETVNFQTLRITQGSLRNQAGTVTNTGEIRLSLGDYANAGTTDNYGSIALSAGELSNDGGFTFTNRGSGVVTLSSGRLVNRGALENLGSIHLVSGNLENFATVTNSASIAVDSGNFLNRSGALLTNEVGAGIGLVSGTFENQVGATIENDGLIQLSSGAFNSRGLMQGDGLLNVNGDVTFYAGSVLQGNPTITASTLSLQGTVRPGATGTVGQMVFNANTRFQGVTAFDLVTPGSPGIGNDRIRIIGGQTATLESGAQFDFHLANPPGDVGDKYEIVRGNVALDARPLATDDAGANRRIVLRTDRDTTGFSDQGTAYYALIARDGSFAQMAMDNGGSANAITMGRYLDMALPQDDRTIGTVNADLQWVRDTLDLMPSEADVASALAQLSGEIYVPLSTVSLQRQFVAYNRLAARLRDSMFQPCSLDQLDDGAAEPDAAGPACCDRLPIRGWVQGYGYGGLIKADENAGRHTYGGGGLQAAFGYQPTERLGFGVFYDFGTFNLENVLDDQANAQAHSWGGYLAWHRDCDYFLFVGGGGIANHHSTRYIELANPENAIARRAQGDHLGGQAAFYGEYGRSIQGENVHVRPYLGLLYMTVIQNAFEETGAGALNLSFEESAIDSFRTMLGGQVDFRLSSLANLLWTVQAAWVHEYVEDADGGTMTGSFAAIPNTIFLVNGPATGRDWVLGGCGVRGAFFGEHLRPFANYDLVVNSRQAFHTGWGGVEYVW